MSNALLGIFLANTYSTYQARTRLLVLKQHLETRFFNKAQGSQDPANITWLQSLGEDFFHEINQMNAYQVLGNLEKEIKKMSTLTLFIAFSMPDEEVNRLGVWLRMVMITRPNLLLEIKIDPNLLAGCALSWKGIYRDYSLRQRIETNKEKIIANLKNYLK